MTRKLCFLVLSGLILLSASLFGGCSDLDMEDPRQVVIAMFGAMEENDQAALAHILDLPELMRSSGDDYAFQTDEPRVFHDPQEILEDLTNDGKTKEVWFSLQRIVNKAQIMGETATVEVTFVDKDASRGYRTAFGLHKRNGKWKIFSFQTMQEGS
ncbi:MAG: hypothetical protein GY867_07980 [bacterium]|nr:hypothetical protein [bacterium]